MDSSASTGPAGVSGSSSEQLRRLTKHLLGPGVPPAVQESRFRSALKVLSTAPAAAANIDDVKMDEFVIAEQVKKFLVRDGRSGDCATFSELHIRLQKSSIIRHRDSILSLFLALADRTPSKSGRRVPPFAVAPDTYSVRSTTTSNGMGSSAAAAAAGAATKSVISIGSDGESYLTKVIPAPYKTRPKTINGTTVISSPVVASSSTAHSTSGGPNSGYHPPVAPKPHYVPKSPCEPPKSPAGAFSHLHLNSTDQQRRQRAPSTPPGTPSSGASSDQAKFLSTALVPIGNDGQVDTAGRIQSDELELKLLRELIYSFQGIEGVIIRKKSRSVVSGAGSSKDTDADADEGYVINHEHLHNYPPTYTQLALRLSELGWLYNRVNAFCEHKSSDRELGLVGQSLITGLRNELTEFYRLLSILEAQLKTGGGPGCGMGLTMHQLTVCTMEPMERMKLLATIVKQCGRLRGGALISAVYGFLHHGDPGLSATVKALLTTVCKPMYNMILKWIFDGTLEDPFTEFFIAADVQVKDETRLWHDKYSIRRSMIPKFMSFSLGKKILATGKSINFLKSVCQEDSPIPGREAMMKKLDSMSADLLFATSSGDQDQDDRNELDEVIEHCYRETSHLVLDTMFRRYKLVEHVSAMRKYLLLGQGDLIRYLLELLDEELCQPAANLYPHNLAGILESAIRATNTQFEDPDILERLDVRLLDVQPGDTGWDVFSLDYKVGGPIGTVLGTNKTMTNYLMLFNTLWRGKRMEWLLSCVWTRGTALGKMARTLTELKPVLHVSHLLSSEMVHFVHQLAYYVTFEVMECSWDILIKQLKHAENLDEVIEAHSEFLETLVKRALLDERSRDLLTQLRAIYDRILEFQSIQNKLYLAAVAETEARKSHESEVSARGARGTYGLTRAEEQRDLKRRHEFVRGILPNLEAQLKIVSQSYQDMVRTFLLQLACSQDQSLQFLSVRLDFNQHYKRKDARLGAPLTYQHRRLSSLE